MKGRNVIVLAELDIDVKALLAAALKSKEALAKVKEELLALKAAGDTTSGQFVKMQADLKLLTETLNAQVKALKDQAKANEKLAESQEEVAKSAKKARKAQEDLTEAYEDTAEAAEEAVEGIEALQEAADDAARVVSGLNSELEKNNTLIANDGVAKGAKTFSDYKNQVGEAFNSINIFNGGLGDFLSRAQQAGGTGKLFKTAIEGMTGGIKGMGAAIKANPIGFLLSLIAPLIEQFKKFAPLTNAVEKAMAGLAPILELASKPIEWLAKGVTGLVGIFSGLLGSMSSAADEAMKLRDAEALLNTEMALQEERNDKAKKKIDELIAKSQDQTLSEGERIKALQDAAKVELDNYNERKRLSEEAYRIAQAKLQQDKDLSDEEMQILQNGTAAQIAKLQESEDITDEELKTLQAAKMEKQRIANEEGNILERQAADEIALQNKIKAEAEASAREADRKRKEQQDKAIEHLRQKLDLFEAEKKGRGKTLQDQLKYEEDYATFALKILKKQLDQQKISWYDYRKEVLAIEENMKENQLDINRTKAQLELDQLIAEQGFKAKTLEEEVVLAQQVADKKRAIAKMEYDAHKDDANALAKFNLEQKRIENEVLQKQAELDVDNARRAFETFKENKKNQLNENAIVNEAMLANEKAKLDALEIKEIGYQQARKNAGLITQQELDDIKTQILADGEINRAALDEKFKQDKRAKEAIDLENERLINATAMQYDLDAQLAAFDAANKIEREAAEKNGADMELFDAASAERRKAIEQSVLDNKLQLANQTFGNIAAIVGKESAVGKAMAVAQATIDTYQAATAAYKAMAGIPVVGPALGGVAAAAAVAAGVQNVKKITGTKTPKAEKGALFSIGGNRHSAGGTIFTGADGTRFEAEQGELIGVMNRNAARHFMAFNNAFTAGGSSAPNYFANGGIVSREIAQQPLNVDELATKIAAANASLPQPVVAVHDIITQGNSYVQVREGANF